MSETLTDETLAALEEMAATVAVKGPMLRELIRGYRLNLAPPALPETAPMPDDDVRAAPRKALTEGDERMSTMTYETGQPWVVYTYARTDEEADALGGIGLIVMRCAICGETEDCELDLNNPPPAMSEPGYKHPARIAFLAAHTHPMQRTAPETWALPLLNPAAHTDTLDVLRDVAEKARRAAESP
jgi:hypothetical protein